MQVKDITHICMNDHIGACIFSSSSPPTSLRRMDLVSRSMASVWDELVNLCSLLQGRVGVCRGYSSLLLHESRPPTHHRSLPKLWPGLGTGPTFYPESETRAPL